MSWHSTRTTPQPVHNLALIFHNLEQWEEAIPYYEIARRARSDFYATYGYLATCYRAIGEDEKSKEVLDDYLKNIGSTSSIHVEYVEHYKHLREYDLALEEAEKVISLDPNDFQGHYSKATVYKYKGDLKTAENTYWKLSELTEPAAIYLALNGGYTLYLIWGKYEEAVTMVSRALAFSQQYNVKWVESEWHTQLAHIHNQTGNHEEALKECKEAWDCAVQAYRTRSDLQRAALHMKGLVQVANQRIEEAQVTADELGQFIEAGIHEKSIRLYYHLLGRIKLARENYSEAIELFQKALSLTTFQDNEQFLESLALAFYKSGDLKKAQEQYGNIIALTPGGVFYGDIYTKSFYMLGKIHEEQGDTTKARENYEKFLGLWKEADPGIAELEDAKTRLAALK